MTTDVLIQKEVLDADGDVLAETDGSEETSELTTFQIGQPETPVPIQLGVEGKIDKHPVEIVVRCEYNCPVCGAHRDVFVIMPVYPFEGGQCPECERTFLLFDPEDKVRFFNDFFFGTTPMRRERARKKYHVHERQEYDRRFPDVLPVTGDIDVISENIEKQGHVHNLRTRISSGDGFISIPSGVSASLMRLQNIRIYLLFPFLVGILYDKFLRDILVSRLATSSVLPKTYHLIGVLLFIVAVMLWVDWRRLSKKVESWNEYEGSRTVEIDTKHLVFKDPSRLSPWWISRITGIWK